MRALTPANDAAAEPSLKDAYQRWLENEQKGPHPLPSLTRDADPVASFLREIADGESASPPDPLRRVGVVPVFEKSFQGLDAGKFDLAKEGLNSSLIFASERHDHVEEGLAHERMGQVGSDGGFFGAKIGHMLSCLVNDAGDTRRPEGAPQAQAAYADNGAADEVEQALRASPDFAPAYAEPGEMEDRLAREAKIEETIANRLLLIALAFSATGICVVLFLAYMWGGH